MMQISCLRQQAKAHRLLPSISSSKHVCPLRYVPPQAKGHRLEVHQQRDRATGDVYYILNGNQRFLEG